MKCLLVLWIRVVNTRVKLFGAVLMIGALVCFVIIFLTLTAALGRKGEIHILQMEKSCTSERAGTQLLLAKLEPSPCASTALSSFLSVNEKCAVHCTLLGIASG